MLVPEILLNFISMSRTINNTTINLDVKPKEFNQLTLLSEHIKKKFKHHTIPVTIQCSGNKRKSMSEYEAVHGLQWDVRNT